MRLASFQLKIVYSQLQIIHILLWPANNGPEAEQGDVEPSISIFQAGYDRFWTVAVQKRSEKNCF